MRTPASPLAAWAARRVIVPAGIDRVGEPAGHEGEARQEIDVRLLADRLPREVDDDEHGQRADDGQGHVEDRLATIGRGHGAKGSEKDARGDGRRADEAGCRRARPVGSCNRPRIRRFYDPTGEQPDGPSAFTVTKMSQPFGPHNTWSGQRLTAVSHGTTGAAIPPRARHGRDS